jgi:hypothetical protein
MRNPPSHPAIRILAYLLELAAREGGYRVRGTRGWATAHEIEEALGTWGTPELMRAQAERQRVLSVDVRAPGESKAAFVYRIARRGVEVLAGAVGASPAGFSDPEHGAEKGVWLRDGVRVALEALRSAATDPRVEPREWAAGEPGWRTSRELTRMLEREDEAAGRSPACGFLSEDLQWLVRMGYADRRTSGKTHVYRVTPRGLDLEVLDWRDADA